MSDTLVLNSDGSALSLVPLSTLNWKESITLLYLKRIQALHFYDEWVVRSPSVRMQVPSVVMVKDYIRSSRSVKYTRTNIFLRDLYRCMFCGQEFDPKQLTLDHWHPRSIGGKSNWANILTACRNCNALKANRMNLQPIHLPYKPSFQELLNKRLQFPMVVSHETWISYLGDWDLNKIEIKHKFK